MTEARQRWRIVFGRDEEARYLAHLDAVRLWERAFRRAGIPIASSEGFSPRPKLVFGAPLPLGMLAEHELADLFLSERLTRADVRTRLAEAMPRGYRLIDLADEWVGAPALATQLTVADYRLTLLGAAADRLGGAVDRLLAAESLPRERLREKKVARYDLRPLLLELKASPADAPDGGPVALVWMRLRHSQERGTGRPEEVVAALADALGMAVAPAGPAEAEESGPGGEAKPDQVAREGEALEIAAPVRERLWLVEELGPV
jgi:radical SAM-linked protein